MKSTRNLPSQPTIPETLTALHKTAAFLPRILPRRPEAVSETQAVEFWNEVLDTTRDGLNLAGGERVARIVVYGSDEHSGARELVTALLEDPFASEALKQSVRERWKSGDDNSGLFIRHDPPPSSGSMNTLTLQSSWLQQFLIPIEVHELPSTPGSQLKAIIPLFAADIPIIVCNPVTTPLKGIFSDHGLPIHHPNAILVITSSSATHQSVEDIYPVPPSLRILFVDPTRALQGLQALSSDPGSAVAVQRYQDDFTESGVIDVTSSISNILSNSESDLLASLRTQTALHAVLAALSACRFVLADAKNETDGVHIGICDLRDGVAELEARIGIEVLGTDESNEVKEAVTQAKQEIKVVMDRLTWWRLLWKVDDIAEIVTTSVHTTWCRNLEDKLIYHAGRLAVMQKSLGTAAHTLLRSYAQSSPFHSPVLHNTVAQIETSPSYTVKPSALTGPIHFRRNQLSYPTNMLHASAQRITIGMGSSVLGGFGIAWAGWAGELGILGAYGPGLSTETAAGLGMFGAVLGVRWAVGRWEKAKKKWWQDWDRVGEGLERDLKATLKHTVEKQVTVVPETVCEGLTKLVTQREEEVEALDDELCTLEGQAQLTRTSS
ncbi:unnamed protein product [Somion occarium]|uniref:Mmc1 C-terminal domain-containing protein n=1 Tax=Somion occarium TaxID=3059160 RepID=A0ABP1DIK7_9APHY